jgi:addiction module RelE/StbE family toxin
LDKYEVKLLPKAYRDIDQIYEYILEDIKLPEAALNLVRTFEEAILLLEKLPRRGAERKIGVFANRGYRQLFIKNFTIVYRIDEKMKYVVVVTIKYSASSF